MNGRVGEISNKVGRTVTETYSATIREEYFHKYILRLYLLWTRVRE